MRYHLKANGSPGVCLAAPGRCPRSGEHFSTRAEARSRAEALLAESFGESYLEPTAASAESKSVDFGGSSYGVTDSHEESRFFCEGCKRRFSHGGDLYQQPLAGTKMKCRTCGHTTELTKDVLLIDSSTLWLLDRSSYHREENVLYHITERENWREEIRAESDLRVHFGNREATQWHAIDLVNRRNYLGEKPLYLYRVRLNSQSSQTQGHDLEQSWDELEEKSGIHVYLNLWENPGSLSVFADQKSFEIIGEPEKLSPSEAML